MRKLALYSLAGIRLANGLAALFAPKLLAERLGLAPRREAGVSYPFRLFGVRTVLLGLELLAVKDGDHLRHVLREGTVIHASDVVAAGRDGDIPRHAAAMAVAISSVNVALTFLAREPER